MLSPLNQVAQKDDNIGVSRLFILASFEPEKIFTFIFKTDVIEIELTQGKTQLWEALYLEHPKIKIPENIQQTIEPFSASEIQRKSGNIRLEQAPEPFPSFNVFLVAATKAIDCDTRGLDGISYFHRVQSGNVNISVSWSNPDSKGNVEQMALIHAYQECIIRAGLAEDH